MTDPSIALRELLEKSADADLLREMIGFAAERLMELEVQDLTGAGYGERTPERLAQRNGGRWRRIRGADWRHAFGPDNSIDGRADHPVVQVSAQDTAAFCRFHGLRLPSGREWEFAARGTDGRRFPWRDAPPEQPSSRANSGATDCCAADAADGYLRTAPVGSFPDGRSPAGLLDMAGNVWERTSSRCPGQPGHVVLRDGGWDNDPYCLRVSPRQSARYRAGHGWLPLRRRPHALNHSGRTRRPHHARWAAP